MVKGGMGPMSLTDSIYPVLAYLDPGAGSMMLQVLLGGSAAVLVILKLTWRRLLAFVGLARSASNIAREGTSRS
jgi:hypothetical protein